jgi:hypothetical protein
MLAKIFFRHPEQVTRADPFVPFYWNLGIEIWNFLVAYALNPPSIIKLAPVIKPASELAK